VADGKWVNVPGKGRRWQQPSGELMREQPGWGFVGAQLQSGLQSIANPFGLLGDRPRMTSEQMRRSTSGAPFLPPAAAATLPTGGVSSDPRIHNAPTTEADLAALREGQNAAIRAYGPGQGAPDPHVAPPERARREAVTAMAQQYAPQNYWESETGKAMATAAQSGPKAGEAGYAQRADIAAWIEANKNAPKGVDGKNIVDRFLEKQRAQGLLDTPDARNGFQGERLVMPTDAESAAQAMQRGADGRTMLQQAQENVAQIQGGERSALNQKIWSAAANGTLPETFKQYSTTAEGFPAYGAAEQARLDASQVPLAYKDGPSMFGLNFAPRPVEAPQARAEAMAAVAPSQPAQAASTGTGNTMQPASAAASQAGVEPPQSEAVGNAPNPADEFLRQRLQQTRSQLLGY